MPRALAHDDQWTEADEAAFLRLPDISRTGSATYHDFSEWPDEARRRREERRISGVGVGAGSGAGAGLAYSPSAGPSFQDEVEAYRNEIRRVKSRVVPFQEPLLFALDHRLAKASSSLPAELQPVGPDHRLCVLIYGLDLKPAPHEVFTRLEVRFAYGRVKGLTYSMIPNTELEERFRAQTSVELAIGTGVSTGVPLAPFVSLDVGPSVGIKSHIAWHWEYQVLHAKVLTYGRQSNFAEWRIARNGLVGPIELRAIVRVPKMASQLPLSVTGVYKVRKLIPHWKRLRPARIRPCRRLAQLVLGE